MDAKIYPVGKFEYVRTYSAADTAKYTKEEDFKRSYIHPEYNREFG